MSLSEKLLYQVLLTYRHNSPPTICDPGQDTLIASTGLSKKTVLKAKKLLVIKGLIKYDPGRGRTNTNKYTFPLEDGTDEEKRRLFAYLKTPKIGGKSNHFNHTQNGGKSNHLSPHKMGENRTTLQPKSDQKNGGKRHHEQYISQSQKKQQQEKSVVADSFSPSQNQKNQPKNLVKIFLTFGIARKRTEDLIQEYSLDNVQKQYTWLFSRNITYPAGALIASLKENWAEPQTRPKKDGWQESEKYKGLYRTHQKGVQRRLEKESEEYKKQYQRLKEASKQRGRLDLQWRRKGKIGKKLNPYGPGGPAPYFADQVPDEICKDCPLATESHPLEHKTHGRLICLRMDVKAGVVGVLFSDSKEKTDQKLKELQENGIPKRRTQPAIP